MFADLSTHLGHSKESPPDRLVVIEYDFPLDSTFLQLHFAGHFAKNGQRIHLFSLLNNGLHYFTAAAKLMINLNPPIDPKNPLRPTGPNAPKLMQVHDFLPENTEIEMDLLRDDRLIEIILGHILTQIRTTENIDAGCLVILDGLSELMDLGCSIHDVLRILGVLNTENGVQSVVVACSSIQSVLLNVLAFRADLSLSITAVGTGFAKDVTGSIASTHRSLTQPLSNTTHLHFLLSDRRVKFFAPGLAPPAL